MVVKWGVGAKKVVSRLLYPIDWSWKDLKSCKNATTALSHRIAMIIHTHI